MKESNCELVAYLDDDCLPDPGWLEYLLHPFLDSAVAAVAGEILRYTDLKAEQSHERGYTGEMRYLSRETKRWFEIASFGGIGSGGNMAFRKESCEGMVLFDERLGRGAPFSIAEENCAFASLLAKGCSVVRIPTARVYHPLKPKDFAEEAKFSIAYWFLLYSKFPENRVDLLSFLCRRILRKPVAWRVQMAEQGSIVSSRLGVRFRALTRGVALYLRAR
jgi:cellulose synthase/poly-beta-1,6-N-acetylglucosamine synthase-like glycosyltransferase